VVQTWRTSEFPAEARDSRLVVEFEAARGGTRVLIRHSDLPPSQAQRYEKGWMEHYLKPLARYFAKGGRGPKTPAPRAGQSAWGRRPERKARRAAGAATAATRKPVAPPSAPRKATPQKAAPRKAAAHKTPVRKLHAPARPAPAARKKSASRRPRR
jgi:hypothetical protein